MDKVDTFGLNGEARYWKAKWLEVLKELDVLRELVRGRRKEKRNAKR